MKLKTFTLNLIIIFISLNLAAQDASFSQFYHAPTIFNPAETGHRTTGGKYRINGVHRNLGEDFKTTNLAFDQAIDWKDRSYLGVGFAFIHDATPSGGFRTMSFLGGISTHLSLDPQEKHFLSFGMQFGVVNNQVRTEKLRFENDILGGESETFTNTNIFNLDSRLGVLYSYFPNEETEFKFGIGANHLITYEDKFIDVYSQTDVQVTGSFELVQHLNENQWIVNSHLLFINQGTFYQGLVGCMVTRNLESGKGISLGVSYRTADLTSFNTMESKDAIIAIFGLNTKNGSRVFVSYDANISPLNNNNNVAGNVEFGFQYIINSAKNNRTTRPDVLRSLGN